MRGTLRRTPAPRRVWAFLAPMIAVAMAGCAHRAPAPAAPLVPIATLAMVSVIARAMLDEPVRYVGVGGGVFVSPGFGFHGHAHASSRSFSPGRAAGAAVGVGIAGALIGLAIYHAATSRQQAFDSALDKIAFSPAGELNARLYDRLLAAGVNIQWIDDGESSALLTMRKQGDFSKVAMGTDAVLDVRVTLEGYYHSLRAGGYSPMLGVEAILWPAGNPNQREHFSYYADFRKSASDPRWITTPPEMTYGSIEDLANNAETARAQLEKLLEGVMAVLIRDIKTRMEGTVPRP